MTQKLLKLSFTVLASPAGSSKETANPQKAVTVIRHQALPSVSLGVQFAGHQSRLLQATSLQGEWQNLSISAAQRLKDAQHSFSESLCSEFGIQSIQQPSSHGSFRITESQYMLSWKGLITVIKPNSWTYTRHPKNHRRAAEQSTERQRRFQLHSSTWEVERHLQGFV